MFGNFRRNRKMAERINIEKAVIEFCKKSKKIPNLVGSVFFGSALEGKLTAI